jgi:arylsulfatase A-like enzyme
MIPLAKSRLKRLTSRTDERGSGVGACTQQAKSFLKPGMVFLIAVWLGLATGFLELGFQFANKHLINSDALGAIQLNQHALWMVPVSYGLIFTTCGAFVALLAWLIPKRAIVAIGLFAICFLSVMSLIFVFRGLTSIAYAALGAGMGFWLTPRIVAMAKQRGQVFRRGLPRLIGVVAILFGLNIGREELRELQIPMPKPGSPNVVLIVLDTVRAKSLSLYGYERRTSPFLAELAKRGVCFEHARTAAAWTLPSHASMFTGRWPYELSTRLNRPLDEAHLTLAEYLRDHGYDTAGFVANTIFCTTWFGLDRGFVHYEDVALTPLEIIRSGQLGRCLTRTFFPAISRRDRPNAYFNRKDAATINGDFLAWLSSRPKNRPFFAFLNYYDAHDPYLTPPEAHCQFGMTPQTKDQTETLRDWLRAVKSQLPEPTLTLARDCYDDCIAYLDGQLRRLFTQLDSERLLENTVVVITSDHGELLGEHGSFGHGQNLYREVAHVPLLIIGPHSNPENRAIPEPVSLRDLPATIVDLLGLAERSPFPGRSLARHWLPMRSSSSTHPDDIVLTETVDEAASPLAKGATSARSLVADGKIYIRGKDGREEMYDVATDPSESHDLIGDGQFKQLLTQFRKAMQRIDSESLAQVAGRGCLSDTAQEDRTCAAD